MIVLAAGTVHVAMIMRLTMLVRMVVIMVMVIMRMMVRVRMGVPMVAMIVVAMVVPAGAVVVGLALGPEGAGHGSRGAALATDEFRRGGGSRHVEHIGTDLGRHVVAAELPGKPHQPRRILRPHLEERLAGGPDLDQPAILETQGIAILEGRGLGQREVEAEATLGGQVRMALSTAGMIEGDGIDDPLRANRGLPDDRSGAQHDFLVSASRWDRSSARHAASLMAGVRRACWPDNARREGFSSVSRRFAGTLAVQRAFHNRNS
jgi:hypothetical protein